MNIIKKLIIAIPLMFITITITFFIGRAFPGNPFLAVFSKGSYAEHELYNSLLESSGLNEPILVQYKNYLLFLKPINSAFFLFQIHTLNSLYYSR